MQYSYKKDKGNPKRHQARFFPVKTRDINAFGESLSGIPCTVLLNHVQKTDTNWNKHKERLLGWSEAGVSNLWSAGWILPAEPLDPAQGARGPQQYLVTRDLVHIASHCGWVVGSFVHVTPYLGSKQKPSMEKWCCWPGPCANLPWTQAVIVM